MDRQNLYMSVTGTAAMHMQAAERFRFSLVLETDRAIMLMRGSNWKDALPLLRGQVLW